MRFRCANRISIFLRSRRDCSKPSVPASDRATSRACSWMSRGILRDGSFGQHCGLSGIYRNRAYWRDTEASCPHARCHSCQAASRLGSGKRRSSDHIESRHTRRYRRSASIFRTREYGARCLSPRPASSASEPRNDMLPVKPAAKASQASGRNGMVVTAAMCRSSRGRRERPAVCPRRMWQAAATLSHTFLHHPAQRLEAEGTHE
jgi:hypothetical protein